MPHPKTLDIDKIIVLIGKGYSLNIACGLANVSPSTLDNHRKRDTAVNDRILAAIARRKGARG